MMTTNEKNLVYDTLLSSPGMSDSVKLDIRASRKLILLFCQAVEKEMKEDTELFALFPKDLAAELSTFKTDCLEKAGLRELNEKLKGLK